jgi:hypothetical protein
MNATMNNDLLTITRGDLVLRLCSNGLRWWMECDDKGTGQTFRHEYRAGSRAGITPAWDRTLADCARGQFTPCDDTLGTWWLIGHVCP